MAIFSWICAPKWPERMQCCTAAQWQAGSPCSVHLIILKRRSSVCSRLLIDECTGEFLCSYAALEGADLRNVHVWQEAQQACCELPPLTQAFGLQNRAWHCYSSPEHVTKNTISRPAHTFGEEKLCGPWGSKPRSQPPALPFSPKLLASVQGGWMWLTPFLS